jgi:FeS assembly SUF system protein
MDKAAETENTSEGAVPREIVGAGPNSAAFATSTLPQDELERMTGDIVAALKTVYDPEIPADIYELGLIYRVDIDDDRTVHVQMTLTAPGCPVAGEMPMWVQQAISGVKGVMDVDVDLVFDPPWTPDRMSEEAQIAVGMW